MRVDLGELRFIQGENGMGMGDGVDGAILAD